MNKTGKTGTLLTVGVIALLAILGFIAYSIYVPQTALGGQANVGAGDIGYISTGATTLTFVPVDALQSGTSVATTNWVGVNGGDFKSGVTSASPNNELEILFVNDTQYHNAYVKGLKVPAAPTFTINSAQGAKLLGNATVTLTMFNTNNDVMDESGAATNQSMSTGSSANMALRLDGQDKKSTQDMVVVLEASDGTKIDKLVLSGPGAKYIGMAKPTSYTLAATTSQIWVYEVPAIEGAVSVNYVIGALSKSGQDASGTYFKVSFITKDYFIDSVTGKVGYAIEDSLGTSQSMAKYSFTDYFT